MTTKYIVINFYNTNNLILIVYTVRKYGVKRGSLCEKSKILLESSKFHSISGNIVLFLQSEPLFYSIRSNYFFTVYL